MKHLLMVRIFQMKQLMHYDLIDEFLRMLYDF